MWVENALNTFVKEMPVCSALIDHGRVEGKLCLGHQSVTKVVLASKIPPVERNAPDIPCAI